MLSANASAEFSAAIRAAGLEPPADIEADGLLHRFAANGKRGDDAGWYILHCDGIPAGAFGDWRTDVRQDWRADLGRQLTPQEEAAHRDRVERRREQVEAERRRLQAEAAGRASAIWKCADPAPDDHPYLARKGVKAHGLRVHDGGLLVPLREGVKLRSLQFIDLAGEKRFLAGGRVRGCYYPIGKPSAVLCIAEGFATGASIYEATGHAVAVAFNAGNLLPVARAMRAKFPAATIVVCADDDAATSGNPGLTKAREAAQAVGGVVAVPDFGEGRPAGASDFNDLAMLHGASAVKRAIDAALLDGTGDEAPAIELVRGADLKPEPIRWLWHGWLARGKLHVLAGAPGTGKTTLAVAFATTVTTGGRWPDGTHCEPGNVLIWSGEDDPADTLLPRLLAAGADPRRVFFVGDVRADGQSRPFDPARDLQSLIGEAQKVGEVRLVIVDPIVNAVAADSNRNAEVRRALQPLVDLASRLDAVALGISHFSKGTAGRDPVERVTGSIAFGALARVVLGAAKRRDEEGGGRILVRAKSNIGLDHGGFVYDLEEAVVQGHPGLTATRVFWGESLEGEARTLLTQAEVAEEPGEQGATQDAMDFLRALLEGGPVPSKLVQRDAQDAGHAWATVRRAFKKLGGLAAKDGMRGGWRWSLGPSKMLKESEDAHQKVMSTFATDEHLRGADGAEEELL